MKPIILLCLMLAGCSDNPDSFVDSDGNTWTWDGDRYHSDREGKSFINEAYPGWIVAPELHGEQHE